MPFKDPNKKIEYDKKYRTEKFPNYERDIYLKNREKILNMRKYENIQPKRRIMLIDKSKKYNQKNRDRILQYNKDRFKLFKLKVFNHYSNYDIKCNCCGEKHMEFLSIDHINNDGAEHRKTIGNTLYRWLVKNNYPMGFQILCYNCNWAKHKDINHMCIHQKERASDLIK